MSKSYQVLVTARTSEYVPDVETEEQAREYIRGKLDLWQFDDVELEVTEIPANESGEGAPGESCARE